MISYFVRYRGTAADPNAFMAYYETRHAAILRGWPNIRSLVLHRPIDLSDPFPTRSAETMLLAQMVFDGAADLDAALHSPARRQAREDFHRFPPFTGEVTHQAMAGRIIF